MKQLFHALQDYLKTVPGVEDCRRYNTQQQKQNEESYPLLPNSVLIEFADIRKRQRPGTPVVDTDMIIRFYVSTDEIDQGEGDEIYDLVDVLKGYLWNYSANGLLMPLRLVTETTDTNHSNFYTFQLEYQTTYTEKLTLPKPEAAVSITELTLATDLDIDNRVLNTGDNMGYEFPELEPTPIVSI